VFQDFRVTWNFIYTGTPIALKKMVNEKNFGSGLATRLSCIPLPSTNFKMMSRESTVDYESDNRLKAWAEKLDRVKGELSIQKLVDETYDWTARRMADAEEFTTDDVMRCFMLKSNDAARTRVSRLQKDGLVEKVDEFVENGTTKARYKKTGAVMV